MEEALTLAQKLSAISFPVLMVLLLYGSYRDVWMWGRQARSREAELLARLEAAEQSRDKWQTMALSGAKIAETSVDLARNRG